jgi:integrase
MRPIPVPFIPRLIGYIRNRQGNIIDPIPHRKTVEMWCSKIGSALNIEAWTTPQSETHEKTKGHIFRKSLGKDMLYGTHTDGRKALITMISQQLGHSDTVTTLKYLREADQAVQNYWEG